MELSQRARLVLLGTTCQVAKVFQLEAAFNAMATVQATPLAFTALVAPPAAMVSRLPALLARPDPSGRTVAEPVVAFVLHAQVGVLLAFM